ncbi:MAG: PAS domain-containing protein [Firmicutes bacterium]|nr:PAS domain-containing protein [Bacillota bacterium]
MRVLKVASNSNQLLEAETMYKVLDGLSDAAVVTEGAEHRVVFVNTSFARINPAVRGSLLGRRLIEIFPRAGFRIDKVLESARRTGETVTLDKLEIYGPAGHGCWKLTAIPERDGRYLVTLLHEITAQVREKLDEAVYKSRVMAEERAFILESLIQSITDPVVLVNSLGQVIGLNREAADYLGMEPGIFFDRNLDYPSTALRSYTNGVRIPRSELPAFRALQGEVVRGVEMIIEPNNNSDVKRFFSLSASPVRDAQGNIILAVSVARDITERVNFEKAKDGFISVASHEMRTPLGIVRGTAQLMEMGLRRRAEKAPTLKKELDDKVERGEISADTRSGISEYLAVDKEIQYCSSIIHWIDQMARMISEVLDASRLESGQLESNNRSFDLMPVIQEVCQRLQAVSENHRLLVEADEDEYMVYGDQSRLNQVVNNLLDNAIKYSPEGGDIRVELKRRGEDIEVKVIDSGVGIPEKDQKYIFERFYRAQNAMPGTFGGLGLGLYISRQIIMEHGGRMWVESSPGKGSGFYFTLPSDEAF